MWEALHKWCRCSTRLMPGSAASRLTAPIGAPTYDVVAARAGSIPVIIPPDVTAVLSATAAHHPSQRDQHITLMATKGRLGWQKETGYGRRSLVETTMGRYKAIIGSGLRARSLPGQRTEAAAGVAVLNRMLHAWSRTPRNCL